MLCSSAHATAKKDSGLKEELFIMTQAAGRGPLSSSWRVFCGLGTRSNAWPGQLDFGLTFTAPLQKRYASKSFLKGTRSANARKREQAISGRAEDGWKKSTNCRNCRPWSARSPEVKSSRKKSLLTQLQKGSGRIRVRPILRWYYCFSRNQKKQQATASSANQRLRVSQVLLSCYSSLSFYTKRALSRLFHRVRRIQAFGKADLSSESLSVRWREGRGAPRWNKPVVNGSTHAVERAKCRVLCGKSCRITPFAVWSFSKIYPLLRVQVIFAVWEFTPYSDYTV